MVAVVALLVALGAVTYAMARGQDVCSVHVTSGRVDFCPIVAAQGSAPADIEAAQPALEAQVQELEEQAQAQQDTQPADAPAPVVDLTGVWLLEGVDDIEFAIQQFGSEAVIQTNTPYGITAYGAGTVADGVFAFQYQGLDGTTGGLSMEIVDAATLRATAVDAAAGDVPLVLRRR